MEEEEGEDRLSSLPDFLICRIIFLIPDETLTQSAITTFTLSKRWCALWIEYFIIEYQNPSNSFWPTALPDTSSVAETLINCRRSNLAKFHLSGKCNNLLISHVNNWIRYAVNCNVKHLDLILMNSEYVLEEFFFINSYFTCLNLFGCVFHPTGAISWKKLKSLCISYTELNEDIIQNILSGCPVLETFELGNCRGFKLLNITSKSVKNLVITGYGDLKADECPYILEIDAPYILSLTIGGYLLVWNILLLNVSSLVKVNLNFKKFDNWETVDEEMFGLITSLLHAKELNIGSLCNKVLSSLEDKGFTFPSNVKVLDSPIIANSLLWWPDRDDESVDDEDSKCFHIRERNVGPFAGRITVHLLKDQTKIEDKISALPDSILIEILSRLPETKHAIRTSTLSKRWIHLWTYISNLNFQRDYGNDFLPSDFFPAVNKTLTQCCETKLYKFELRCCRGYNNQFKLQVKSCIRYAVTLNVEEIYLELFNEGLEAEFVLDDFFFTNSSITKMNLEGCIINPTGVICWEKLKSLRIHRAIIDEDLIENMLTGSPMLETLELENCSGYNRLNITSKSVKNLIFSGYLDVEDEENVFDIIEINAPNILSLTITGELLLGKLVLLNVASLVNAHLDYSNDDIPVIAQERMLKEFIISLQHVKELKIGIDCFKPFFNLEATGFAFPCNLKILDSLDGIPDWSDWSSDDDDSDLDSTTNGDWKEL